MQCPYCQAKGTATLDSRQVNKRRRRRRHCKDCGERFTTEEVLFDKLPQVSKSNERGTEGFSEHKLRRSLEMAVRKRNIPGDSIEDIIGNIKGQLYARGENDISAAWIGQAVMRALSRVDWVAYIRYASVYRDFNDLEAFISEIHDLKKDLTPEARELQLPLLDALPRAGKARK